MKNVVREIDGIELRVSVSQGETVEQTVTAIGVYEYPLISAELVVTEEFDETTMYNEMMPVVKCNYSGELTF